MDQRGGREERRGGGRKRRRRGLEKKDEKEEEKKRGLIMIGLKGGDREGTIGGKGEYVEGERIGRKKKRKGGNGKRRVSPISVISSSCFYYLIVNIL